MHRIDFMAERLNNKKLLSILKRLAGHEKRIQTRFLCYLSVVDSRKLYAIEGYPTLYAFLTEYLGYSESSALKRSQIAKKARQLPGLYYAIKQGKLSLTSASRLCPFLSESNFDMLVDECEKKSVREVERIIAKHFPKAEIKDSVNQKISPLSIDQVSVRFTADTAFEEKLKKAQELLSHKYPEGKIADVLSDALDALLKEHKPKKEIVIHMKSPEPEQALDTRYISREIQKQVRERDEGQCCYLSPSGKRCSARRFLHIDHVKPYALGGSSHDIDNLRLLCPEHNRLRAKETFEDSWQTAWG